nr:hypothetical protein GCM10020063_040650 [Dactylosporangium thailandense]
MQPAVRHRPAGALERRRIAGLFDLCLVRDSTGAVTLPHGPAEALSARRLADLVLVGGGGEDDVRILVDDGARSAALFGELAGLLGRDVLVSPAGTAMSSRRASGGAPELVPVDAEGNVRDWQVIQPPELATALPGWFTLSGGTVRHRRGTVALPLPNGLALATRADFVSRRASTARLRAGHPDLTTVAVTVRDGGFVIGAYDGTQDVRSAAGLAAAVADLPLFGTDLRLWLAWPSAPHERSRLAAQAAELARLSGATVWTPPIGGRAVVMDDGGDLGAIDADGRPAGWHDYPPTGEHRSAALETDRHGRLVPAKPITISAPPVAAADDEVPPPEVAPLDVPPSADAPPPDEVLPELAAPVTDGVLERRHEDPGPPVGLRPPIARRSRRGSAHGVAWLPRRPPVNTEPFEVYVPCATTPRRAAVDGVPSPDLFLLGRLEPRPITEPRAPQYLLRIRVEAGGAVELGHLSVRVPSHLQHLVHLGLYLLPIGWLEQARLVGGYELTEGGPVPVDRIADEPVTIRSTGARHGIDGLPNEAVRWPQRRPGTAYAMVPETGTEAGQPGHRLPLLRRRPRPEDGFRLVQLRIPRRRAIDAGRTAAALGQLTALRPGDAEPAEADQGLVLPSRSYERVEVRRVYLPVDGRWRRAAGAAAPLADLLRPADAQSPAGPERAADDDRDAAPGAAAD